MSTSADRPAPSPRTLVSRQRWLPPAWAALAAASSVNACGDPVHFRQDDGQTGGEGGERPSSGSGGKGLGGEASASVGGDPSGGGRDNSGGTSSGGRGDSGGASSGGNSSLDCNAHDLTSPSYMEACFATLNGSILTAETEPRGYYDEDYGGLTLYPTINSWRDGAAGYYLYQELSGNFSWEVEVSVQDGLLNSLNTAIRSHDTMVGLLAVPWEGPLTAEVKDAVRYSIRSGLSNPEGSEIYHLSVMAELFAPDADSGARPVEQEVNNHSPTATDHMRLRLCRVGRQIWTGYRDKSNDTGWTSFTAYGNTGYETGEGYLPPMTEPLPVGITAEFGDSTVADPPRIVIHRSEIKAVEKLDDCKAL